MLSLDCGAAENIAEIYQIMFCFTVLEQLAFEDSNHQFKCRYAITLGFDDFYYFDTTITDVFQLVVMILCFW